MLFVSGVQRLLPPVVDHPARWPRHANCQPANSAQHVLGFGRCKESVWVEVFADAAITIPGSYSSRAHYEHFLWFKLHFILMVVFLFYYAPGLVTFHRKKM